MNTYLISSSSMQATTPQMVDEADGEVVVHQSIAFINSLIASIASTKCFPAKWQSIRDKLDHLSSLLAATEYNLSIAEIVQEVEVTLGETQFLAQRCSEESYTGGKLRLRSDLDVVISQLELHIKHLSYTNVSSGMLTNSSAIVLSKPGAGATREEMKFYLRDLFVRLRVEEWDIKGEALTALNEILHENDKYVRIAASEMADGLTLLVSLLEYGDVDSIQDDAVEAVMVIAGFDCYNGALVAAGAIAQLVQVLETGSGTAKERAARALKHLTENSENAWAVSSHEGVMVLLKICSSDVAEELIGTACIILRNISGVCEIKKFMVEKGLVCVLIKLSQSQHELTQIRAIEFLSCLLASEDSAVKQAALRDGTLDSLVNVLDSDSACSSKARELALRAIEGLCLDSPPASSITILTSSGFLQRLLFYVKNGEITVQESALKAVSRLCGVSVEAKKAMGDGGFMQEMVKLLEAKSFEVREMAAQTLCSMISVQRNRKLFIGEENNVNHLLQLLDPEEQQQKLMVTKQSLLSLLTNVAQSKSGRRKLAASGYMNNLNKLAEIDVAGAKTLIKKISSNSFKSILTGIWRSYHSNHQ